jgi:hypothetical protein
MPKVNQVLRLGSCASTRFEKSIEPIRSLETTVPGLCIRCGWDWHLEYDNGCGEWSSDGAHYRSEHRSRPRARVDVATQFFDGDFGNVREVQRELTRLVPAASLTASWIKRRQVIHPSTEIPAPSLEASISAVGVSQADVTSSQEPKPCCLRRSRTRAVVCRGDVRSEQND